MVKEWTRQKHKMSPLLLELYSSQCDRQYRQDKIKHIQIGKEKVKMPSFATIVTI